MPNDKGKKLYQYLKKTGSDAVEGYDDVGFASDIENPEKAAKLFDYLQKTGNDAIEGYDREGFVSDLSASTQEPAPIQQQPQPQQKQQIAPQQQAQNPPNLQKVGKYGTKEFDSNSAQLIATDVDGNDILRVRTTDGMEHDIVRYTDDGTSKSGTYDWYGGGEKGLNKDITASNIKKAANPVFESKIITKPNEAKDLLSNIPKFDATLKGEDIAKNKMALELEKKFKQDEINNQNYKKAAAALTRVNNADDEAIANQSETERHATNIKTGNEIDLYNSDNTQSSVKEYKVRLEAIDKENQAIGGVSENLSNALKQKYGQKYDDYLEFLGTTAESRLKDAEIAKQKGDITAYNNIVEELSLMRQTFSDIEQDDAFKFIGSLSGKNQQNITRKKELLVKDNFKIAREVLDDQRMLRNAKNYDGNEQKKQQDNEWNNGDYLSSIWDKTKQAVGYGLDIAAESSSKVPKGLLNATTMLMDALPTSEGGKLDFLHAANNHINRQVEEFNDLSVIDDAFKNTNTYSVMKGLADLAPQAGIAMATGGAMNLVGLGAEAIGVTAFEITSQSIAGMGFMASDMYDANMAVMDDIEGLTDDEKARAVSRLTLFQAGAVGAAGSLLGGALGSAMNKSGILDSALGRWINSGAVSQAEMREMFKKSAGLLKSGNVAAYIKETSKGINGVFKKNWGESLGAQLYGVAKAGGTKIGVKGIEEVAEEKILEPVMQYAAEQTYALMGGDVDIQALYQKQDEEEKEMRKQSGRTAGDDYLSIFLVGAIAKGAGDLYRGGVDKITGQDRRGDAMFNTATLAALKDLPNFQKELQRYKESQLKGLEVGSEAHKKKKEVLDEIETNVNAYIEDVRNVGVKNKSGGISTWDAMSKEVDESKHENLVQLLSQRAVLNREAEILAPSKALQEAYRGDAREGMQPTVSEAYSRKVQQIRANEEAIGQLMKTPKEVWQGRKEKYTPTVVSEAYQRIFGGKQSATEKLRAEAENIEQNANDNTYSFSQFQETEAYKNASEDERNEMAVRHETPEGQIENAKIAVAELKTKETDNRRINADKIDLSITDIEHNTSVREHGDNDNIVYRKGRQYQNATQAQVDKIRNKEKAGGTFTKDTRAKKDSDFVVERFKDDNGNWQHRIFEKSENGYDVVYDEIGDKATMNSADVRNVKQTRYNNQMSKAEAIRDKVVNESKDASGGVDMDKVQRKLKNSPEYQKEIAEAKRIQPDDSIFGRVTAFANERVAEFKKKKEAGNVDVKKRVEQRIADLKSKNEVKEVDC